MTSEAYTVVQLAQALGIHASNVKRRARKEAWPFTQRTVRGGYQRLYAFANLPAQVQAAVAITFPVSSPPTTPAVGGSSTTARPRAAVASSSVVDGFAVDPSTGEILGTVPARDSASLWAVYERAPEGMKAEAARKHKAVLAVAQLVDSGTPAATAISVVSGLQLDVAESTLARWWYKTLLQGKPQAQRIPRPDWLAALCDRYVGRTATAECDPQAWDWYKGQYLSRKAPSHADTYRRLQAIAQKKGWTIPSGATLRRRLDAEVSPMVQVLEREGPEALARMLPPQERDRSVFAAGEAVNGDGLKFDRLWVRFTDGEALNTTTAWFWQDINAGKVLAWRAGKTENTDMFRLATYDLSATMAKPDQRVRELGRIHCLKRDLGLDDEAYRNVLWAVARVDSAAQLDAHDRIAVIHLQAHAQRAGIRRPKARQKPAMHKAALVSKVRALLMDAKPRRDDAYADGMAQRMFGVERFTWCEPAQLHKLVAALSIDQRRRKAR